ncbi:MAG: bifunctional adenosylcobinamide kinase/adenosylcobinamide-phosphate guanylyltransferase [Thermoanaerobaculia bacterium]
MLTLITGGARSGKSRYALWLAAPFRRRAFIATAEPLDEEMRRRIAAHRRDRDASFHAIEEPLDLAAALAAVPAGTEIAVIDCLTLWLGNLVHRSADGADLASPSTFPQIAAFLERLDEGPPCGLIVVTNEVGMGIVPADPVARAFRDLTGWVNQELAARARRLILMVSGVPFEGAPSRSERIGSLR